MAFHLALQVCKLWLFPGSQSDVGRHTTPAKPFSSLGGGGLVQEGNLDTSV